MAMLNYQRVSVLLPPSVLVNTAFYWILRSHHDRRCQQKRRSFLVWIAKKEKHEKHSMALRKPLFLAVFLQTLCQYLWVQKAVSTTCRLQWFSHGPFCLRVLNASPRVWLCLICPGQLGLSYMIQSYKPGSLMIISLIIPRYFYLVGARWRGWALTEQCSTQSSFRPWLWFWGCHWLASRMDCFFFWYPQMTKLLKLNSSDSFRFADLSVWRSVATCLFLIWWKPEAIEFRGSAPRSKPQFQDMLISLWPLNHPIRLFLMHLIHLGLSHNLESACSHLFHIFDGHEV